MKVPAIRNKKVRIVRLEKSHVPAGPTHAVWDGQPPRMIEAGELYLSGAPGYERAYEAGGRIGPYFHCNPIPKRTRHEYNPYQR